MERGFPDTRESLVLALGSDDDSTRQRAFDLVVRTYRAPVLALLERRWSLERADAEDLAQEFFATALEKDWLARFDANRGRFRAFLRSCLFAFVSTERQAAHRLKRGGAITHVSLDDVAIEAAGESELDNLFEHEWRRSILGLALDALNSESQLTGRESSFAVFRRYDIEGAERDERPTYATLAQEFDLPVTQVTNYLAWARRRFRAHVLATVRALSGSEAEYRDDLRSLLGVDPADPS